TVYLIRHGETEGSGEKRYKGSIDVPLSLNGIEQVKQTARFIRSIMEETKSKMENVETIYSSSIFPLPSSLSAVYCSPLSRALRSAEIIAEPHGVTPVIIPDIRERSFGIWEGMTFTEIKEKHPVEFEAWANNPLDYSPIEGESTLVVKERVIRALDEILSNHPDGSIAIVAHGGVNRVILCHLLGIPLENIFRIEQDFSAVNIIELWERYPVIRLLNYSSR
ncbi:MAG: histidine phosphatase family protein, partial [Nitrospirales bacterium]|nr:histidine phosphatase family protein [Nitrospirales bacterium]